MNNESNTEYMLFFRGTNWTKELSPEQIQTVMNQMKSWYESLTAQGKLKAGHPLEPEGKIISGKNGSIVADGPFAESKEAIGGYFLISAKSMDEAVAIAKACPGLQHGGIVEVRPVAEECPAARAARAEAQLAHA